MKGSEQGTQSTNERETILPPLLCERLRACYVPLMLVIHKLQPLFLSKIASFVVAA